VRRDKLRGVLGGTVSTKRRSAVLRRRSSTRKALNSPDEIVFRTRTGTPLSPKNLYNRVLAPACDRIKQPRISWHSFRHTHATLLAEVGESISKRRPEAVLTPSSIC
jgi:integrase